MINFLEVYERALKGPIMSEKDFDMKVFIPKLKNVVKTYGIQYAKETPVTSDDKEADNLYKYTETEDGYITEKICTFTSIRSIDIEDKYIKIITAVPILVK